MARPTLKGLARNSAFGIAAELWRIASRFILTPLIIAKLGLAGYGIWTVLFSITAQFGIVNNSFGAAYSKLTAEYDSKGDYKTLSNILSSGMVLVLGFAVVALTVLWWIREWLLGVFNVPAESLGDAANALMLVATVVLIQFSAGCVMRGLEGMQRLDLVYLLNVVGSAIDFFVTILLLSAGFGLMGMAVGFATGQLLVLVVARYFLHRIEPRIRVSLFLPTISGIKTIASLGGKFQVLAVMGTLFNEGSKLFVSALLGVRTLAVFEIAFKLIALGSTVGRSVVGPLMPAFSFLHSEGDKEERAKELYTQASRVLSVTTAICFAFLAVFAHDVVLIWTGGEYPMAGWTLRMLVLGSFLHTLTGVGTASLRGRGRTRLELSTALWTGALIFVPLWPLTKAFGYQGLVFAFVLGGVGGPIFFLTRHHKTEGIPLAGYLMSVIGRPALAVAPAALASFVLSYLVSFPPVGSERIQALLEVASWGFVFALVAGAGTWWFVLQPAERRALAARLRRNRGVEPAST